MCSTTNLREIQNSLETKVKYIHFRRYGESKNSYTNVSTLKKYDCEIEPNGGITMCSFIDDNGLHIAFACCHIDDMYNKKTGNEIALMNLIKNKKTIHVTNTDFTNCSHKELLKICELVLNESFPGFGLYNKEIIPENEIIIE